MPPGSHNYPHPGPPDENPNEGEYPPPESSRPYYESAQNVDPYDQPAGAASPEYEQPPRAPRWQPQDSPPPPPPQHASPPPPTRQPSPQQPGVTPGPVSFADRPPPPRRQDDTVTLAAVQVRRVEASSTIMNTGYAGEAEGRLLPPPPPERDRVSADEFANQMERLRSEASAEQRTAWAYLGLLGIMTVFVLGFGYGCSPDSTPVDVTNHGNEDLAAGEPTRLVVQVNGDVVQVSGDVVDDALRSQILTMVASVYGEDNIIDQLSINPDATLEEGTVRFVGAASASDNRPQLLLNSVSEEFELANRGFELSEQDGGTVVPVNAQLAISPDSVMASGVLPDEAAVASFSALLSEVWPDLVVVTDDLRPGTATWENGVIRVVGETIVGDQRVPQFAALVPQRIANTVSVDSSGLLEVDLELLAREVETNITNLVQNNPIAFQPLSADIDPSSDPTLEQVASELNRIRGVSFEIVGHTDSAGPAGENQVLSEQRAQAVADRLIQLGVDAARITVSGEGESNPIVEEVDDATRAQNRRIEFSLDSGDDGG